MSKDFVYVNENCQNKCVNENAFVFSRVSVPRDKACTNSSNKLKSSTTTRNRFDPLQYSEVSQSYSPNTLGEEKLGSLKLRKPKYKTGKSSKTSVRNPNPTGDIWDQSSLNLNTLFQVETKNNLRIGIWNAESVRHKENQVKDYILDNNLDIFIILESWLHKDELPSTIDILPCVQGYKLHQLPRPDRKNSSGGGMLCIFRENIEILKLPTIKMKVLEVMDLKLVTKNRVTRLVSVYRPPRTEARIYPVADFYNDMEKLVSHYKTLKDEIIFCGDYNVHLNKPGLPETCKFNKIIESADFRHHITDKTHIKGNTLDLVMSESHSSIINKCYVGDFLSDHAVILVDLNLTKPPKSKKLIRFRKNKDVDIKKLESQIENNLKDIGDINNLTELVDSFNLALSNAYNEHAPLISKIVIMRPPTPWSYNDIKEDKATRRRLERKWRHTGLQIDRDLYTNFQKKFNAKLNDFRNKQYAEMIEENKHDPTTLFKVINHSLHRNQASPLPEGLPVKELAEKFSTFFAEKIDKIRSVIDDQQGDNMATDSNLNKPTIPILNDFKLVSECEVEKLIRKFPNKYCELDPIPLSMLKECLLLVLPLITKIVNLSLKLGDMPTNLKKAIIKPLLKKLGLELEFNNYRPVSNLSFLSKLIEKIVAIQFIDHLIKNGLTDPLQSAYKKGHSTETALLKVQNDILIDIDNNNVSVLVMLDLSAAFDTIDHDVYG